MKPAIILSKTLPDDLRQRLDAHFNVTDIDGLTPENLDKYAHAFQQAEGLLKSGGQVDATLLAAAPRLRAVSTISAGYDNVDVEALTQREIVLMHTPTVLTETVADIMMALVLASARRVVELAEFVRANGWDGSISPELFAIDVHHKKMGILGMGRIGMALAQRAHFGFSMDILYHARKPHSEVDSRYKARYTDLETLLRESDFVCISLPLTEQTYHLIGRDQLAMMKKSAILINAGRGPVVDESALIEALKQGAIYAAGLDVFEEEPLPMNSALLSLPNVVALPHVGSATHETRYGMARDAVDNLIAALSGKVEKNCVNPQVLKS
ncbi:gluconate 2-dehydrogenase [Izhakiella capsodis]|uniref:Glyoxylate/hydroxypyruvate reductase B n=1 Tax=Izhakiella capsodis TaxID=1367852 RepID=A0A1I5A1I0_9GAMM|nr:glyoxylate/hydroxypyruvate reductase GhrB [Izhakiella capsodis]SFN56276.1 gluconate 2-dehydrogenase [Izhakiella capsodis]